MSGSLPQQRYEGETLFAGLVMQWRVVGALILRELATRFGRNNLGALWAVLEPTIMIGTLTGLFVISGQAGRHGLSLPAFFASGFIPWIVFRMVVTRMRGAIAGNRGLLMFPQVTPVDLIWSRFLLEIAIYTVVATLIVGILVVFDLAPMPDSPLGLFADLMMGALLGFGFGLSFGSLAVMWLGADRIIDPLIRFLFFATGVFFVPADLPSETRDFMMLNPLLHVTEFARISWLSNAFQPYGSLLYVGFWIAGLAFLGLLTERMVRPFVERMI